MPGVPTVPEKNLIWALMLVWPSLATEFVISDAMSVRSAFMADDEIVVPATNVDTSDMVPEPFRAIACYPVFMSERTPLTSAIHAVSLILAMMAEDLEKSGAMKRKDFARRLRDTADDAEATAPERLKQPNRLDLAIARHVADLMDRPGQEQWTPVVIEGGKQPEGD
jgi:hypothetical protein